MITLTDLEQISIDHDATFVGLSWNSGDAHGYPWPTISVQVEFSEDAAGVATYGVMLPRHIMAAEAATVTLGEGMWQPVSVDDLNTLLAAAQTRFGTPDNITVE